MSRKPLFIKDLETWGKNLDLPKELNLIQCFETEKGIFKKRKGIYILKESIIEDFEDDRKKN